MKRSGLLAFVAIVLTGQILAQSSVDGLLKNGRSVTYYKNTGAFLRDLEPEENEYQQWAMAKTLNIFKEVSIASYRRVERWSTDIEDIQRSRDDDKANLPAFFKGFLAYEPVPETGASAVWNEFAAAGGVPDSLKAFVSIEANVRKSLLPTNAPLLPVKHEMFGRIWHCHNATLRSPFKRYEYRGPVTVVIFGAAADPVKAAGGYEINGTYTAPTMLSVRNIVITICANEERTQQILAGLSLEKVDEVLRFKERWP